MTETTQTFGVAFAIAGAASLDPYLDAFVAAGCDDAAFIGPAVDGTFVAEFDREARDLPSAVVSAIHGLRGAVDGLRVLRVVPDDLVTIAAIAINHVLELDAMADELCEHPDELAAVVHLLPREFEPA